MILILILSPGLTIINFVKSDFESLPWLFLGEDLDVNKVRSREANTITEEY